MGLVCNRFLEFNANKCDTCNTKFVCWTEYRHYLIRCKNEKRVVIFNGSHKGYTSYDYYNINEAITDCKFLNSLTNDYTYAVKSVMCEAQLNGYEWCEEREF